MMIWKAPNSYIKSVTVKLTYTMLQKIFKQLLYISIGSSIFKIDPDPIDRPNWKKSFKPFITPK